MSSEKLLEELLDVIGCTSVFVFDTSHSTVVELGRTNRGFGCGFYVDIPKDDKTPVIFECGDS